MLSTNLFRGMFASVIKMLQYETTDASERIDPNKSDKSNECMICHYCYFSDSGYRFEPYIFNNNHDLSMVVYDINYCIVLHVKDVDYRCYCLI